MEASALLVREFNDIKSAKIKLLTLPGEACEYNGASYYVINRRASSDAVAKFISGSVNNFDKNHKLTDGKNALINGIYEKNIASYKLYSDGKIEDIQVN